MFSKKEIPEFKDLVYFAPKEILNYINRCGETPQSKTWHPEGNVLIHIMIVFERARKTGDKNMAIAAFFHDLGKADVTKLNKRGSWGSYGHEFISARLVKKYAEWIKEIGGDPEFVHEIVINHMKVKMMHEMRPSKRELFNKHPLIDRIKEFSEFDNMRTLTEEEMSIKA